MKTRANPVALLALAMFGMSVSAMGAQFEDAASMHSHHHSMEQAQRQMVEYTLPEVKLVRDDGKTVSLADELNDGRPVVLNFFYTNCTEICPLTSQTFMQFQSKLGSEQHNVHMVSISVDPEQDTPAVLREYARKYRAGPGWQHYSGTVDASIATQKAFDVYRGDKMNHTPVTLMRASPGKPWLRIDGFSTPDELLREYLNLVAAK